MKAKPTPRKLISALKTLRELTNQTDVSRHVVISFFSDLRQAIEALGLRNSPDVESLQTVCDWTQHSKLNRKSHFHVLQRLTYEIAKHGETRDISVVCSAYLYATLSLREILRGLNALIRECDHPKVSAQEKVLRNIYSYLITELASKPISALKNGEKTISRSEAKKRLSINSDPLAIATEVFFKEGYKESSTVIVLCIRIVLQGGELITIEAPIHGIPSAQ